MLSEAEIREAEKRLRSAAKASHWMGDYSSAVANRAWADALAWVLRGNEPEAGDSE